MSALDNVPGLAGYVAAQQQGQAQQVGQLQQLTALMGLQKAITENEQQKQLTGALANTGQATPDQLEAFAARLAIAKHPAAAAVFSLAEKRRAAQSNDATLRTMQSQPGTVVPPDAQQTEDAFNVGAIPPEPTTTGGTPGLFGTLMQSDNPMVAQQAKALQAQMDKTDARSIPPKYWQDRQNALAQFQAAWDRSKELKALAAGNAAGQSDFTNIQPDGKGGYIGLRKSTSRMEAVPMAPGTDAPSSMSEDAVKAAAWEKLLFGREPTGMGNANAAQKAQVRNEWARIGKELGLTPMEMAMLPQDNKVKMKAVSKLTDWGATVARSAQKLDLDLGVALDYAKKMPLGQVQAINRALIAGRKAFNDPTANAYAAAINSVRQEYARLMSGPTSNAMLPVEAMKKGNELLSSGVDVASLEQVGNQMRRDAANTITATNTQINGLRGSIQGLGKGDYFTPVTPAGAPGNLVDAAKAELARRQAHAAGK